MQMKLRYGLATDLRLRKIDIHLHCSHLQKLVCLGNVTMKIFFSASDDRGTIFTRHMQPKGIKTQHRHFLSLPLLSSKNPREGRNQTRLYCGTRKDTVDCRLQALEPVSKKSSVIFRARIQISGLPLIKKLKIP